MSERKLASIRKISKLSPIKDADRIEVAHIDGWKVVTQKGIHKEGDLVVYFEIDSLLPELPEFEFLRKSSYVKETNSVNGAGFRLKTIKLKKQVSQGLIVPIRELFEYDEEDGTWQRSLMGEAVETSEGIEFPMSFAEIDPEEGDDLTEILGVKKYEKPVPASLAGKIRGNFPSFIPKTDQERVQNFIPDFNKEYRDHEWEVSLKLDGSSMTVYYNAKEDRFGVCSRNLDLYETEGNAFWQVARKLDLENKLRQAHAYHGCGSSYALQGELMGPGVQGNRENLKELGFYVFDVWDIDQQVYLAVDTRIDFVVNELDIDHIPVYGVETFSYDDADDFLKLAEYGYNDGKSINHPEREGLVFKSVNDPSVSFKAISNKFLLGDGE